MKKVLLMCGLVLASICCFGDRHAFGDVYLDAGVGSNLQEWATGDYTAGSEFTVNNAIDFNSLGYIDAEGDGLSVSHMVGLWRTSDQALLAQVLVTPGSQTVLTEQGTAVWYMENIGSTMTLGPGTYRVAGYIGSGDQWALSNDKIGNGVSISAGYVRTDFPGGFNYPNLTFGSEGVRATVGLLAVPEPTSAMVLIGCASTFLLRRRR